MQRIAVKTDHGYTYEYRMYKNGLYDPEATDKFNQLQKKAEMGQAVDFFKEVVGINDYIRMVDGIDPLTGKKITNNEQAVSSLMFLLTVVSEATALKVLKNMGKGSKALEGVKLTKEDSVVLKSSKGYQYLDDQLGSLGNKATIQKYESAESVNTWWKKQRYDQPPYKPKTVVQKVKLLEDTKFVRVYDGEKSGLYGGWVMRAEDVKGLTPLQIQEKFALPQLPKYIGEVTLPKGSTIRAGEVNPLFGRKGGGFQFDMMQQRIGEFKELGKITDWSGK